MKRAIISILVASLCAVPVFAGNSPAKAQCVSLEHVRGAWQMQITCDQGAGTISVSDDGAQLIYRGTGVFSTWSQEQLKAMYESLAPRDNSNTELLQLG